MDKEYISFLADIKKKILTAQYDALRSVNLELIKLYLYIGQKIYEKKEWGKAIVKTLSYDLQKEYPGIKGFSTRNLWNMRKFYIYYLDEPKLQPLVAEISWAKNIVIMDRCKDPYEKEFYLLMVKKAGWTKDVLLNQIENKTYEKYLTNQTNFDSSISVKYRHQAKLAVKDEYTFDFLELARDHSEIELERSLISKLRSFLIEMGNNFCYVSNQFRIEVSGKEYFIDLLLYHRKLRCLIAIDLKISEFIPEYAGKMQFYLSALDNFVKMNDENPSIGIIICKNKDKTTVEFALKDSKKPIGVSTYKITSSLPRNVSRYLPSKEEIVISLSRLK